MVNQPATIWLDDIGPTDGGGYPFGPAWLPFGGREASVRIFDSRSVPVGPPSRISVPDPVWVESIGEDGELAWSLVQPPLSFDLVTLPRDGRVELSVGSSVRIFALDDVTVPDVRKPDLPPKPHGGGSWTLALMAEMFDDWASFETACMDFYTYIRTKPPFVTHDIKIVMLYWQSGSDGIFATKEESSRRIFGDRDRARKFLQAADVAFDKSMVIMNHPKRGGAGGFENIYPAWASIGYAKPHPLEKWQDVALHELGHAFGLQDEYTASWPGAPAHSPDEPNVTKIADALSDDCPWSELATKGHSHNPTWGSKAEPPASMANVVGTFQGARYCEKGFYRPSARCCMRSPKDPFCPVCQAEIVRQL